MNKEELLHEIRQSMHRGELTSEELLLAVATPVGLGDPAEYQASGATNKLSRKYNLLSKTLYLIGGIVVLSGIVTAIANNWASINPIGHVVLTCGLGISFLLGAVALHSAKPHMLVQVFYSLAAILMFIGGFVLIDELQNAGIVVTEFNTSFITLVSAVLLVIFGSLMYGFRERNKIAGQNPATVLYFIEAALFAIFYYSVVFQWMDSVRTSYGYDWFYGYYNDTLHQTVSAILNQIFAYTSALFGVGLIALAQTDAIQRARKICSIFTFAGYSLVLVPLIMLVDTGNIAYEIWTLLYVFVLTLFVIVSIRLRNTMGLILTSLAIGAYCIKISVLYFFADNLGFPLILLGSGLLIMVLGYFTYYLNNAYINGPKTHEQKIEHR